MEASSSSSCSKQIENDKIYIVEDIVNVKRGKHRQVYFLVKWQGYPHEQNTWEPEKSLSEDVAVAQQIENFKQKYPDKMKALSYKKPDTGQKNKHWEQVTKDEIDLNDLSTPREMVEGDEFYGQIAGSLTGETKRLFDPTHKVSSKELLLAKVNANIRVTRSDAKKIFGDVIEANSCKTETLTPKTIRKRKSKNETVTTEAKETEIQNGKVDQFDDIFTAEEDTAEEKTNDGTSKKEEIQKKKDIFNKKEKYGSQPTVKHQKDSSKEESIRKEANPVLQIRPKGSDDFQILRNVDWSKGPINIRAPKQAGPFNQHNFVKAIEECNEVSIRRQIWGLDYANLKKAMSFRFNTGETLLYVLLLRNQTCSPSHDADGIIRLFCRVLGKEILTDTNNGKLNPPLCLAVQQERTCTLRTMLTYLPNVNILSSAKKTPLQIAFSLNKPSLVKHLLEAGASYTEADLKEWKKSRKEKELAWSAVNTHISKMNRVTKDARDRFLLHANLELVPLEVSPIFQRPGFLSEDFRMTFKHEAIRIPNGNYTFLLFIYVCSIGKEPNQCSARCWGKFVQGRAPELNGKEMIHAQDSEYPMVFFCPIQHGQNTIDIFCSETWKNECQIITAQVVYVRLKPVADHTQSIPENSVLEKAPLVGPLI